MNKIAFISSILVIAGCFLPWLPGQNPASESMEWMATIGLAVVSLLIALYNVSKKTNRFQLIYTIVALVCFGVITLQLKIMVNTQGHFSATAAGAGLYLLLVGAIGLLICGMSFYPKLSLVALLVAAGTTLFVFQKMNRQNEDLSEAEVALTVDAVTIISEFEKDSAGASRKYIDQLIMVTGQVKAIDTSGIISLGDPSQMSSVQCTMDGRHRPDYAGLKEGMKVSVKGKCNGYETQDLLGTDVKMNFCVLNKNK